jgi:nucleoside-diphosphate-sugar epimerase
MRLLIIGGTGLISTEISNQLLGLNVNLTLLNRNRTPNRLQGEVELIVGDRRNHTEFEGAIRTSGPWDCVIDINCSNPEDAESLRRASRGHVGQVIFCSTSNVYPKPATRYPVREDEPHGAAFEGGRDKSACERIHSDAHEAGEYNLTILRPAHTYGEVGPILHSLGNSTSIVDRIASGRPICVHGDGAGLWSAAHASDVARGFVAACGNDRAVGGVYNVTGDEWFTWNQYYETLASVLGVSVPERVFISTAVLEKIGAERAAQCSRSFQFPGIYDNTRARADLDYRCEISLRAGMKRHVEALRREKRIVPWEKDPEYDVILEKYRSRSW